MDFAVIEEIVYFAFGISAAVISAYGGMKASGRTLYPVKKIEAGRKKIHALTESNEYLGIVAELINEISEEELMSMIAKKKELDAMPEVSDEQKAITLGMMFLNAMKQ